MSTATRVSLEEYLHSVYEPECDYVDGVLEDRHTGLRRHSEAMAAIAAAFFEHDRRLGVHTCIALRTLVAPNRVRVPDVCIIDADERDEVPARPPRLCIEIRCPEDRSPRLANAIADYLAFGVPVIWIIDPYTQDAFVVTQENRAPQQVDELHWRDVCIPLGEILPD